MREKVYLIVLTLEVQGRSSTDSTMSGFGAFNNNNDNNNNNNNETVQDALQMKGKAIKRLRGHKKKKKTIIPVSKNY